MFQASVRSLAIVAGIDPGCKYKDQSITKLAKLMQAVSERVEGLCVADSKQARESEPYLARFEDDWVTGQILRRYINGKRKYESAKANGMRNSGDKQQRTIGRTNLGDSDNETDGSNDEAGSNCDDGDEWAGINHDGWFACSDRDEDMEADGGEDSM
jgi:hypothetical protein